MLTRFQVENFKSYKKATLRLSRLTILVGANASGKSNLVESLRLFSWLAEGRRVHEIHDALRSESLVLRGQGLALLHTAHKPLRFNCRTAKGQERHQFSISLKVDEDGMRVVGEELEDIRQEASTLPFYRVAAAASAGSNDLRVDYNNFARGGKKPHIIASDQQAVLTQVLTPARFLHSKSQKLIPAAAGEMRSELSRVLFLDPVPGEMRGYSVIEDRILRPTGSNLSAVLFDLCKTTAGKASVLDFVRDLPEQDIKDIDFVETPRKEVLVALAESFGEGSTRWDASALSDGTLRVLAVAAAVLSVAEGSLVVIEELDNGLHPSRARKLLEALGATAKRRSLRLLLTTHNPALLDAVSDESLPDVAFCYRDPVGGDSRIIHLEDIEDYPSLVAQGRLGDLVVRGLVDRYVKHPRLPAERRKAAQEWLKSLPAVES